MPEESKVTVPLPEVSSPSQTVCAVRVVATLLPFARIAVAGFPVPLSDHIRAPRTPEDRLRRVNGG
ncbi:hypothetical protein GCM10010236_32330 [Streptomyces eurythermus]|nr:hypothetical protein GCM10010236_32330 [Streptomyces eurythermus]